MRFEYINRKFTETVTAWISRGYNINSATMGGHQGEIAKIDLTDGKEIVRILLTEECKNERTEKDGVRRIYHYDLIALIVGRATDQVTPNGSDTFNSTIWNERLEVLRREEFYCIGERHGRNEAWYGTKEEATAQQEKRWDRYSANWKPSGMEVSEKAKAIVLPFVRRQPKCKTAKVSDIESVTKHDFVSRAGNRVVKYTVKARGMVFDLH